MKRLYTEDEKYALLEESIALLKNIKNASDNGAKTEEATTMAETKKEGEVPAAQAPASTSVEQGKGKDVKEKGKKGKPSATPAPVAEPIKDGNVVSESSSKDIVIVVLAVLVFGFWVFGFWAFNKKGPEKEVVKKSPPASSQAAAPAPKKQEVVEKIKPIARGLYLVNAKGEDLDLYALIGGREEMPLGKFAKGAKIFLPVSKGVVTLKVKGSWFYERTIQQTFHKGTQDEVYTVAVN